MAYLEHLHGNQFEAFLLETSDDLTDQSTLDTIRLDHDKGTLLIRRHNDRDRVLFPVPKSKPTTR